MIFEPAGSHRVIVARMHQILTDYKGPLEVSMAFMCMSAILVLIDGLVDKKTDLATLGLSDLKGPACKPPLSIAGETRTTACFLHWLRDAFAHQKDNDSMISPIEDKSDPKVLYGFEIAHQGRSRILDKRTMVAIATCLAKGFEASNYVRKRD